MPADAFILNVPFVYQPQIPEAGEPIFHIIPELIQPLLQCTLHLALMHTVLCTCLCDKEGPSCMWDHSAARGPLYSSCSRLSLLSAVSVATRSLSEPFIIISFSVTDTTLSFSLIWKIPRYHVSLNVLSQHCLTSFFDHSCQCLKSQHKHTPQIQARNHI